MSPSFAFAFISLVTLFSVLNANGAIKQISLYETDITPFISTEMDRFLYSFQFNKIGYSYQTLSKSEEIIYEDVKVPFHLSLPVMNSNIDNGNLALVDIISENEKKSDVIFSINYDFSNSSIGYHFENYTVTNKKENYTSKESDINIECNLTIGNLTYDIYSKVFFNKINCIKYNNYLSFGLCLGEDGKFYVEFKNNNNNIIFYRYEEMIKNINNIKNYFLISEDKRLLSIIFNDTNENITKLNTYEIITNKNDKDIYFKYLHTVNEDEFLHSEEEEIYDIKIINTNTFVISTSLNGLLLLFNNTENKYEKINLDSNELVMNGQRLQYQQIILVDANVIYGLVKGFGIVLFNIISINQRNSSVISQYKIIHHSKINDIIFYVHPFNGYKFIGLKVSQEAPSIYTEFYIELLLSSSFFPQVNRIYTSKYKSSSISIINSEITDVFHLGFFCSETNSVFITRRAVLNSISTFDYLFNLSDSFSFDTSYITNIVYPSYVLQCEISTEGTFRFILNQPTEVCSESIASHLTYCSKTFTFDVNMASNKENIVLIAMMSIGLVTVLVIVLVFLIASAVYSKGFKDYSQFKINVNENLLNDRDLIYQDKEEEKEKIKDIIREVRRSETGNSLGSKEFLFKKKLSSSKSVDIICSIERAGTDNNSKKSSEVIEMQRIVPITTTNEIYTTNPVLLSSSNKK